MDHLIIPQPSFPERLLGTLRFAQSTWCRSGKGAYATCLTSRPLRHLAHFIALCTCFILPFTVHADWHRQQAAIMGTAINVELWHEDAEQGRSLTQSVLDEMQRIDNLMSTYKPDSELSFINDNARQGPGYRQHRTSVADHSCTGLLCDYRLALSILPMPVQGSTMTTEAE